MKCFTVLIVIIMLFNAGCATQNAPAQKPQAQQQSLDKNMSANGELAGRVVDRAKTVGEVKDCAVMILDREISVAVRVTGFDRLKLKSIRKEVYEKISHMAPGYQVHVTTDKKLYSEVEKLNNRIQRGEDPGRLKADFDEINKKMHG